MKSLKTQKNKSDIIDYALNNIGSYNVIFKHAKWTWFFLRRSTQFLYIGLIWINLVFSWYLYVSPLALWSLLSLVPLCVAMPIFSSAANAVIQKQYPQYQKEGDWTKALPKIEKSGLEKWLKTSRCFNHRGIKTVTEMVFKEEKSDGHFSFFLVIFIGGFIPLSSAFLSWLLEHKVTNMIDALHVFGGFVILMATFGFIVFMEESWAKTKSDSKREVMKRTRRILDRLYFESVK